MAQAVWMRKLRGCAAGSLALGIAAPSKVCQSLLNRLVRSGPEVLRSLRGSCLMGVWGGDLSSAVSCGIVGECRFLSGSRRGDAYRFIESESSKEAPWLSVLLQIFALC